MGRLSFVLPPDYSVTRMGPHSVSNLYRLLGRNIFKRPVYKPVFRRRGAASDESQIPQSCFVPGLVNFREKNEPVFGATEVWVLGPKDVRRWNSRRTARPFEQAHSD